MAAQSGSAAGEVQLLGGGGQRCRMRLASGGVDDESHGHCCIERRHHHGAGDLPVGCRTDTQAAVLSD